MDRKLKISVAVVFTIAIAGFFFMLGYVVGEKTTRAEIKDLQYQVDSFIQQRRPGQPPSMREQLKEQFLENPGEMRENMKKMRDQGVGGEIVEIEEDEKGNTTLLLETTQKGVLEVLVTNTTKIESKESEGTIEDLNEGDKILVIGKPLQQGEKIIVAVLIRKTNPL